MWWILRFPASTAQRITEWVVGGLQLRYLTDKFRFDFHDRVEYGSALNPNWTATPCLSTCHNGSHLQIVYNDHDNDDNPKFSLLTSPDSEPPKALTWNLWNNSQKSINHSHLGISFFDAFLWSSPPATRGGAMDGNSVVGLRSGRGFEGAV